MDSDGRSATPVALQMGAVGSSPEATDDFSQEPTDSADSVVVVTIHSADSETAVVPTPAAAATDDTGPFGYCVKCDNVRNAVGVCAICLAADVCNDMVNACKIDCTELLKTEEGRVVILDFINVDTARVNPSIALLRRGTIATHPKTKTIGLSFVCAGNFAQEFFVPIPGHVSTRGGGVAALYLLETRGTVLFIRSVYTTTDAAKQ